MGWGKIEIYESRFRQADEFRFVFEISYRTTSSIGTS